MNIQDAGKIKLDAKRLKEMKKSIPKIVKELHELYNWVGEEIIDYEAKQALNNSTKERATSKPKSILRRNALDKKKSRSRSGSLFSFKPATKIHKAHKGASKDWDFMLF